jgi:proteic killer suppression protein
MIRSFRHKGLKRLFEENDARGLNVEHMEKLRRILARMDSAKVIADMDLPGYRLHALKGDLHGFYSVTVRANWRVIFQFEKGEALNVDYVDYH